MYPLVQEGLTVVVYAKVAVNYDFADKSTGLEDTRKRIAI